MRHGPFTVVVLALALAACDRADMASQPKGGTWDRSTFFPDGASMRPPVPGTEPRGAPNGPVPQPPEMTQAMLARGRERYDIFCSPCHGRSGDGQGMIVKRGFPAPPGLAEDALLRSKAAFLYDVITNGHGNMYAFADRVPPVDRWAIVAYLRALQLSQGADPKTLPAEDLARLEAAP